MKIQLLKQQSAKLFFQQKYTEGLEAINQCINQQPNNPQLYVNRALYQYKLGHTQQAVSDLHHSISLDYLNYKAYFNLFALQIQSRDYQQAFKNICCCLSIVYLLQGLKQNNEQMIQKSIQYSFNNKQSRLMKSIYKVISKKYIQALNQINYALYLHPSNSIFKSLQSNIYKQINMKQLVSNTNTTKQKYTRLETNKIVPPNHLIYNQINKLVREFNEIAKNLNFQQIYIIKKMNRQQKNDKKNNIKYYQKQWCIKIVGQQLHINGYSNVTCGKISQEPTNQSFNPQITIKKIQKIPINQPQFNHEPQTILDTSISNLSISNISQDSIIKMSRVNQRQLFDVSQCFKYQKNNNRQDNSINLEENSNNGSMIDDIENRNIRVNLPKQMFEDLKQNERVVLSFQKMQVDKNGDKKQTNQLYELVLNNQNNKFQLIKCNK